MNEKGWTQAELARRVAPLLKNSRIGRDNISKYVRGKVLPLPHVLDALALGCLVVKLAICCPAAAPGRRPMSTRLSASATSAMAGFGCVSIKHSNGRWR
jgi:hypothetical protein